MPTDCTKCQKKREYIDCFTFLGKPYNTSLDSGQCVKLKDFTTLFKSELTLTSITVLFPTQVRLD